MISPEQMEALRDGAGEWGISLSEQQLDAFSVFTTLLEEQNRVMNLTRIPLADIVPLHFLDSLSILRIVPLEQGARILDLGSGAGFPGIPVAIARPDLNMTLLDATNKKVMFLQNVVEKLALPNCRAVHGRAEEMADRKGQYVCVTARAVASMDKLAGWMLPFVKKGGVAVAMKSSQASEEIEGARKVIQQLGAEIERVEKIELPGTDITRLLAVLRKR